MQHFKVVTAESPASVSTWVNESELLSIDDCNVVENPTARSSTASRHEYGIFVDHRHGACNGMALMGLSQTGINMVLILSQHRCEFSWCCHAGRYGDVNADSDNSGNGGAGTANIIMMLTSLALDR